MRAVVSTFVAFGCFAGSWSVMTPEVSAAVGGGEAGLGALLTVALVCSAAVNAWAGALAERLGTAAALRRSSVAFAGALVLAAAAPAPWGVAAGVVLVLAVSGAVDVVANVAATAALAEQPGRMLRVHATFNVGGAVGAGAVAGLLAVAGAAGWRWTWLVLAVVVGGVGWWAGGTELPAGHAGVVVGPVEGLRVLRRDGLVPLAVAFALGTLVEGGVATWGVLRLRDGLDAGLALGAAGAVAGYLLAGATRVSVSRVQTSAGARRLVAAGSLTAAAGLLLLAAVPHPAVAAAGLVLAAGGVSVCWPLLLSEVGRGRERPGPVVGAVTGVAYLGLVVGPGLAGLVAAVWSLPAALVLLAAAAAAVPVLVGLSRRAPRPGARAPSAAPGAPPR